MIKQFQNIGGIAINLKDYQKEQDQKNKISALILELKDLKAVVKSKAQELDLLQLDFFNIPHKKHINIKEKFKRELIRKANSNSLKTN